MINLPRILLTNIHFVKHTFVFYNSRNINRLAAVNQRSIRMLCEGVKSVEAEIIKSAEDKRSYCGLELNNGMKVLLVSDPTTDKSSAAMDVHVGSMLDPVELPGLAHFCEHMLFLGTEKYPQENEYSKYLSEHGGSSNAFTSAEHTNYFFDVGPDHLKGALDRFAAFFTCPLFMESCCDREVNAVNSENDKNIPNDFRRINMVEKTLTKAGHDYGKFGTGNKETLDTIPKQAGLNVRDELLKFHDKYYSSNTMGLTVLGKEGLEELRDMVLPLFTDVKNKELSVHKWEEHPFGPEQLQKRAYIVPVKDLRSLSVTWPMHDLQPYYKSNPGHYLGHLIGHEGPGSLLSELKARGWVNTLVGGQKNGARGFMFFTVNVDLSEEGIEHTDDIITLIFQYLNMLQEKGPLEWVYKECQKLNAMQFRFKDKERPSNYTCHCSSVLHDYPMKEALCGGYLLEEYRPDIVTDIIAKLTPDKCRVAVIGQKYAGKTDKTEKWYGTEYMVEDINKETIETWRSAGLHPNLKLPECNEFIPTNFDLATREEEAAAPVVLQDTCMSRLWYRQDDKYLLPKGCISIELMSPYAYMDPLSTTLSYMFTTVFQDALNEYAYAAELSGLNYELHNTVYGLTLSVRGYSDKQHILLQRIMEKMTNFTIDSQRFQILKENYIRALKNFRAEQPYQHAVYYSGVLTTEHMWTKEELLEATDDLTVEKVQSFIPVLLSRIYLEMLVYGNVSKQHALKVCEIVENTLVSNAGTKPLLPSQQKRYREVMFPDQSSYLYKKENEVHKSSALMLYYQCGRQSTRDNMLIELFCQIINEPCFDQLRTKEQLGYIVFSGVRRASGCQGLRVILQSDRTPEYVEARVEAFLLSMQEHLDELSDKNYEDHVSALATRRLEQPKKMIGQHSKYWAEIVSQQYNFQRDTLEVASLKTLTKEDVQGFYKSLIAVDAPLRRKISVHVSSTLPSEPTTNGDTSENGVAEEETVASGDATINEVKAQTEPLVVGDVNELKRGLGLYALPMPFIKLAPPQPKL